MSQRYLSSRERRSHTIEAVINLAEKQNSDNITTTAIALHMGLTQGALFRHFPTKDALWRAVMEWVANRLLDRIDRAAEEAQSPVDALQAIFFSHVTLSLSIPVSRA